MTDHLDTLSLFQEFCDVGFTEDQSKTLSYNFDVIYRKIQKNNEIKPLTLKDLKECLQAVLKEKIDIL